MSKRPPLYPTLLRLRHVHPNAWQRALLGEGALVAAGLLVLADVATAWALLVVPLAVALVVKAHDVLTGLLRAPAPPRGEPAGSATSPGALEQGAVERAAGERGPVEPAAPRGSLRGVLGAGDPPTTA